MYLLLFGFTTKHILYRLQSLKVPLGVRGPPLEKHCYRLPDMDTQCAFILHTHAYGAL